MSRLTKAQRAALEWFAENSPAGWFPIPGPSRQVRLNLERLGYVAIANAGEQGLVLFTITPAGRAALQKDTDK